MGKLSASLEDYLETILELRDENNEVKALEISKSLNVAKSSVTDALKVLKAKKMVYYEPYQPISLTKQGEKKAKEVAKKHAILYTFLKETLKINDKEAIENACRMEHVISPNVLKAIENFNCIYCTENCKYSRNKQS